MYRRRLRRMLWRARAQHFDVITHVLAGGVHGLAAWSYSSVTGRREIGSRCRRLEILPLAPRSLAKAGAASRTDSSPRRRTAARVVRPQTKRR
jgi:hypothetical protein